MRRSTGGDTSRDKEGPAGADFAALEGISTPPQGIGAGGFLGVADARPAQKIDAVPRL